MSNRLIVESKNDKFFIHSLISYLNINNVSISEINVSENDYLDLDGLSVASLERELKTVEADAQKSNIDKVGIILDADDSQSKNLNKINEALIKVFPKNQRLEEVSQFISIQSINFEEPIQVACYFVNVNGTGELETLLKAIKSQDSTYADCLDAWQYCLQQKNKEAISQKDFDKFWVNNYIRFDTCSKKDKKQAKRKCSMLEIEDDKFIISGQLKDKSGFDYIMSNKQHIWDFEHPALDELKVFLKMFD